MTLCFGCATRAAPRYSISVDNIMALRGLSGKKINLGNFTANRPGVNEFICRAAGPITTPDSEPFEDFIRKAFLDELRIADVYSPTASTALTGNLNEIGFSSLLSEWDVSLTVASSNGKTLTVVEKYEAPRNFNGSAACNLIAQTLVPAVQDLIGKVVNHPDFRDLLD